MRVVIIGLVGFALLTAGGTVFLVKRLLDTPTVIADEVDEEEDNQYKPQVQERVSKAEVEIRAVFPKTIMSLNQLKALNKGCLIELDVLVENKRIVDPVILELEGKPKLLGKLGQMREKRAVMISGPVEDEDL